MKKIKAVFVILFAALLMCSFAACKTGEEAAPTATAIAPAPTELSTVPISARISALKGPTGMGMAKLMEDGYQITLASAPDDVTAEIIKGSVDIAAVPVNLASILYKKTGGEVQLAAVNTLGVLHLLENGNTVNSLSDLKGKTIYATGQGSTPECALRYVLTQNGIDPDKDVTIEFLSEHAELAAKMVSGDVKLGLLPEPNVTAVLKGNENVRAAIDLSAEWDKAADGESKLTMGCIVVSKKFAQEHKAELDLFLSQYQASVQYVNQNVDAAAELIAKYEIVPSAAVAKSAIPKCNITFIAGEEMQTAAGGFLKVLFDANPTSVGGVLPDENFYYKG